MCSCSPAVPRCLDASMTTSALPAGRQALFPSISPTGRQSMRSGRRSMSASASSRCPLAAPPSSALYHPCHTFLPTIGTASAVNVTANWPLIRTLDPLLGRSDASRVIFVTSSVAHSARAYSAPYSVSKAALEALARTYADRDRQHTDQGESRGSRRHCDAHARRSLSGRRPGNAPLARASYRDLREARDGETEATGQIFTPKPQAS
jgi:hypothetical protein